MRPARIPSARVKIRPWYYTDRGQPSRADDKAAAISADLAASTLTEGEESYRHKDCVEGECSMAPRRISYSETTGTQ